MLVFKQVVHILTTGFNYKYLVIIDSFSFRNTICWPDFVAVIKIIIVSAATNVDVRPRVGE